MVNWEAYYHYFIKERNDKVEKYWKLKVFFIVLFHYKVQCLDPHVCFNIIQPKYGWFSCCRLWLAFSLFHFIFFPLLSHFGYFISTFNSIYMLLIAFYYVVITNSIYLFIFEDFAGDKKKSKKIVNSSNFWYDLFNIHIYF